MFGSSSARYLPYMLLPEPILMHKVEREPAMQQCFIKPLRRVVHVVARTCPCRARPRIQKLCALPKDDADVRHRPPPTQVSIVLGSPAEIVQSSLLPPAVFAQPRLPTHEVVVRNHTRRRSLTQPHRGFRRTLRSVPPRHAAGRVRRRNVGGKLAIHDRVAHPPLQRTSPHCRIAVRTPLVVRLEPRSNLAQPVKVRAATHVAT